MMAEHPALHPPDAAALGATLEELSGTLRADAELLARPSADPEGNILHQDQLLASARRIRRVATRIAELSQPLGTVGSDSNRDLADLWVIADGLRCTMEPVIGVAEKLPRTVEDFYIPLGPAVQRVERACLAIEAVVERFIKHSG